MCDLVLLLNNHAKFEHDRIKNAPRMTTVGLNPLMQKSATDDVNFGCLKKKKKEKETTITTATSFIFLLVTA